MQEKKKEIARFIEDYPHFKHVCITFNQFYTKRKSIKAMLNAYDNIQKYWKEELIEDKLMDVDEPMQTEQRRL